MDGTGDAGALLDAQAKAAYRRRLQDLRADADEAEAMGDGERAARARQEIDALAHELARAVGLGGRDRRAAAPAERARVNVSRAIKNGDLEDRGALAVAGPPPGQHRAHGDVLLLHARPRLASHLGPLTPAVRRRAHRSRTRTASRT